MASLIPDGWRNVTAGMDRFEGHVDRLDAGQAEFHQRMAYLEGLLDSLREATVHRSAMQALSSADLSLTRETDEASVLTRGLFDFFIRAAAVS